MRRLTLLFALPLLASNAPEIRKGELVPRVACVSKPRLSYALYLPSGYREDRVWPVLFGFSPGGLGEEPVRLFQKAAERLGWIVVGSHDSRNGAELVSLEASEAMWKDVRSRFKVDPKRSYAVGFSGGARMAMHLALKHPKDCAGLISLGAFFASEDERLTGLGHLRFFLSCGREDFNHWELKKGRGELQSRGWKALADRYEGGHRWAPEATAELALSFMQLGAIQDGLAPKDPALEVDFRQKLEANGEEAGTSLLALRRWRELTALFPASQEGQRAAERATRLDKDLGVIEELKLEGRYEQASRELYGMARDAHYLEELTRHSARLKTAPPVEQVMIHRLLGGHIDQFRLAIGDAVQKKAWDRVLGLSLGVADLDEREGWPFIYAAISLVQLGRPGEAIPFLRQGQGRGYRKAAWLRELDELKSLRGNAEFEAILRDMATAPPAGK